MAEHSPLPWRHELNLILDADCKIVVVVSGEPDANLDLIVKAVNNHERLVKALSEMVRCFDPDVCRSTPMGDVLAVQQAKATLLELRPKACAFQMAWAGCCRNAAVAGEVYCGEHLSLACRVCQEQATHLCPVAGSLVCGEPICDKHSTCGCA